MVRSRLRSPRGFRLAALILACSAAAAPVSAAPLPFPEAVQASRVAAEAVLDRSGTEHCLRGKLTNALLGLSSSCEAHGQRSELCSFADRLVVTTGWSVAFMEASARQLLQLATADLATLRTTPAASGRP